MGKTIWKLEISVTGNIVTQLMPKEAKILCVQTQFGEPQIWFMCNPENEKEERLFRIFGTGHEISSGMERRIKEYVGTFQMDNQYVFHLFELTK